VLKEKVKIMWGATFAAQTNLSAKIDSLSYTYFNSSSGYEVIKDTVVNVQDVNGTITFPLSVGFGMAFKKGDRWLVAADYAIQNWSTYKAFNQTQGLKNSMRVSLGLQFVPNAKATGLNNYHKRMFYRAGLRYNQSAIELKSTPLVEYAVSAGIGLPVGRNFLLQNFSMVNIGFEFGQRGTVSNGLIKEQFFRATVGFTMNDRWFVKPKFD
jgi:long-subunit fatty acid transport protein